MALSQARSLLLLSAVTFRPYSVSALRMAAKTMSEIKDVDLDKPGVFKYIQVQVIFCSFKTFRLSTVLQVTDKSDASNAKIIVRGYERCHYHCDIFDEIAEQVKIFICCL